MTSSPSVGVVVLNWNGAEDTCRCLESLRRSTYPNLRIIVVDNGSRDGQVDRIEAAFSGFIDSLIENDENLGYAAGNNVGIEHAVNELDCEYVLVLNNDTVVGEQTISGLVVAADRNVGVVGPKIRSKENPNRINSAGGRLFALVPQHRMRGAGERDRGQYDEPEPVDFVSGACMLVRSDVFEEVGLIPSFYFLQWEDIDFCTRVREAGYTVRYAPRAEILHEVNASFERERKVNQMVARGFRNRIWFYRAHTPTHRLCLFFLTVPTVLVPVHLLYYLAAGTDREYVASFLKGLYLGVTTDVGSGPDPDPRVRGVAERAKSTPQTLGER